MDDETFQIEYEWQGTNLEGMPTVFVEATFQFNEAGRHPLSDQMEYEDELAEFDCSFDGFGEDSCKEALERWPWGTRNIHDIIKDFILEEWRKR